MFSTDDGVGSLPSPSSPSPTNLTRVATPDLLRRPDTLMPSTSSITTVDAIKETERENAYLMRAYREKEEELEEVRTAAAALEEKVLALSAQLALSSQERQQRDQAPPDEQVEAQQARERELAEQMDALHDELDEARHEIGTMRADEDALRHLSAADCDELVQKLMSALPVLQQTATQRRLEESEREEHGLRAGARECVVCLDRIADRIALPCGHLCLCSRCSTEVLSRTGSCPVCRGSVRRVQPVFT